MRSQIWALHVYKINYRILEAEICDTAEYTLDIRIQAVLQHDDEELLYEGEGAWLHLLPTEGHILTGGEDEDVQRCQVRAGAAVRVGAVLAQYPHAVQVKHLQQYP